MAYIWHVLFFLHFLFVCLLVCFGVTNTHSPISWLCWICKRSASSSGICCFCLPDDHTSSGVPVIFVCPAFNLSFSANNVQLSWGSHLPLSLVSCKIRKPTSLIGFRGEHATQADSAGLHPRTYTGKVRCSLVAGFKMVTYGLRGTGCEASTAESTADRP